MLLIHGLTTTNKVIKHQGGYYMLNFIKKIIICLLICVCSTPTYAEEEIFLPSSTINLDNEKESNDFITEHKEAYIIWWW